MNNKLSHHRSLALGIAGFLVMFLHGMTEAAAIDVKSVTSPAGIRALLVEDHTNPIIAMKISFRGGSALDPVSMSGLANLVSATIDEGSGDLDSQSFQQRLEELSIRLSFSASRDNFHGTLTTLSENKDEAFRMLRLSVSEPRFDEEPVERIRSQILASLRSQSQYPDSIAGKSLFKILFGSHPYGMSRKGTEETVTAVTVPAMRTFVKKRFARDNLVVGVTGDISAEELARVLDDVFGTLPAKAAPWQLTTPQLALDNTVHIKDLAVSQSAILFAQRGLERSHEDFYAAYVLNYILGGGSFVSRLYNEVREKRGLAYSAYSYLSSYDHAALLIGGAGTANERVGETVQVIRDQWQSMRDSGVSAEELRNAKTYLIGSYPLRFSSSGAISNMLVGIQLDRLGADYFEKRNSYMGQVTLADVNRVARNLLDPDSLTFVVAGQPEGLSNSQ